MQKKTQNLRGVGIVGIAGFEGVRVAGALPVEGGSVVVHSVVGGGVECGIVVKKEIGLDTKKYTLYICTYYI